MRYGVVLISTTTKVELKNIGRSRKAADKNMKFMINIMSTLKVIAYATDNTYYVQNDLN